MKGLLFVLGFALAVALVGRAIDNETERLDVPQVVTDATAATQPTYQGKTAEWWARRAVQARKDANKRGRTIRRLRAALERHDLTGMSPTLAIKIAFGGRSHEALRVAWCESRYDVGAQNGQYLGLFQMGEYARSRYGHGWDPLTQARAAAAYFNDAGWSPWECKP